MFIRILHLHSGTIRTRFLFASHYLYTSMFMPKSKTAKKSSGYVWMCLFFLFRHQNRAKSLQFVSFWGDRKVSVIVGSELKKTGAYSQNKTLTSISLTSSFTYWNLTEDNAPLMTMWIVLNAHLDIVDVVEECVANRRSQNNSDAKPGVVSATSVRSNFNKGKRHTS